ncbi:MAG: hypothetical protein ACK5T0_09940 [Vampirovibrionales bacterium]
MTSESLHEEELSEVLSIAPKVQQEEMAKQWGYIAGSLTFVLLVFPQFFSGVPSPDYVGISLLGTGVMYVLGYFIGNIWHAPRRKPRKKAKKSSKTNAKSNVKELPENIEALEKEDPATATPVAEVDTERQTIDETETNPLPLEEA